MKQEKSAENTDPIHQMKVQRLVEGHILMNMTQRQASFYAGFSPEQGRRILKKDPIARREIEELRKQMATRYEVSKERVVRGMVDAIERAKMLGQPNTELTGWKELGRMHGMYAPTEHRVHVSKDAARIERELQELPHHELLKIAAGSGNWAETNQMEVIDGEFVEVGREEG